MTFLSKEWQPPYTRPTFIFMSILFQYLIPSLVVGGSYISVCWVSYSSAQRVLNGCRSQKLVRQMNRRKKTNLVLIASSLFFFVSWAPLNIQTAILHTSSPFQVNYLFMWVTKQNIVLRKERHLLQHLVHVKYWGCPLLLPILSLSNVGDVLCCCQSCALCIFKQEL